MKRCTKCKRSLPEADFRMRTFRGKRCLIARCKECLNEDHRISVEKNGDYKARQRAMTKQWMADNAEAVIAKRKADYAADPEKFRLLNEENCRRNKKNWRDKRLRAHYGITERQYNLILESQGGRCAICRREDGGNRFRNPKTFAVDHDHETGAIRGLLCDKCNSGIGLLGDDPNLLMVARDYLLNPPAPMVLNKNE